MILGRPIDIRWHPFQLNPKMPIEGIERDVYRKAKFGSLEYSRQLDARVAENGREVGIEFRHDLMRRTPNTFRGHVLLAAALKETIETQDWVAEGLFTGYFLHGEDVGDPEWLVRVAREFGVTSISKPEDLDDPDLAAAVRGEEQSMRESGVEGVPLIMYSGAIVSEGAAPEDRLATRLRQLSAVN